MIVEPLVQGAAGMQLAPAERFAVLGEACREHDVLLICDEVATGFGRTGTLFASEQCGLRPDLLCLGKGLTAGYLAMSATVASGRVFDAFLGPDLGDRTLYHGHSFGGNALAAAVALRHLELIDACDVLANVRARSEELRSLLDDRIAPLPAVKDVRLQGLMGGVELAPPTDATLRWGRRVRAAAVDAACSCARSATSSCSCRRSPSRPPSSTASSRRSRNRIVEVTADREARRELARVGRGEAGGGSAPRASGARRATSTPPGRRASSHPTGGRWCRSRRTTTSD